MRGANQRTSLSVGRYVVATPTRYGFLVALAFGGGAFVFELAGGAMFAGLAVFAGGAAFAGLFIFSLVAVLQPTAKAPRAKVANSAAIFDLVMKPPLLVSGYRALYRTVAR